MVNDIIKKVYYACKPLIPRSIQLALRRAILPSQMEKYKDIWPIDKEANEKPVNWKGWPENKQFALVLTHDVDTAKGQENCMSLSDLEMSLGFNSAFNIVPERYPLDKKVIESLHSRKHEIGVHDLKHDGHLYDSKENARLVNNYLDEWQILLGEPVSGFRSAAMLHNLEWLLKLNISHDESTFDTDPFEPQPEGVSTIFPFTVKNKESGYVELPYTLPQDFTLLILMRNDNVDIWKEKLAWLAENGGMALINIHPDYMNFLGGKCKLEQYPAGLYKEFLEYVSKEYGNHYWHALPRDVKTFWQENNIQTQHDKVFN